MKIIQVVGYKNSGKTTVTTELTRLLRKANYRVGTIKNHGHGGRLKTVPGTDSELHLEAGSLMTTVLGGDEWITTFRGVEHYELTDLIDYYEQHSVDVLIIEGLKEEDYPKIVLIKEEKDIDTLLRLTNIQAVAGWKKPDISDSDYFSFENNQLESVKHEIFALFGIEG